MLLASMTFNLTWTHAFIAGGFGCTIILFFVARNYIHKLVNDKCTNLVRGIEANMLDWRRTTELRLGSAWDSQIIELRHQIEEQNKPEKSPEKVNDTKEQEQVEAKTRYVIHKNYMGKKEGFSDCLYLYHTPGEQPKRVFVDGTERDWTDTFDSFIKSGYWIEITEAEAKDMAKNSEPEPEPKTRYVIHKSRVGQDVGFGGGCLYIYHVPGKCPKTVDKDGIEKDWKFLEILDRHLKSGTWVEITKEQAEAMLPDKTRYIIYKDKVGKKEGFNDCLYLYHTPGEQPKQVFVDGTERDWTGRVEQLEGDLKDGAWIKITKEQAEAMLPKESA